MKSLCYLALIPWLAGAASAAPPVYVYLYARVTDHVNLDMTEDRLRHVLPMVERYRKEHPDAHVSAAILFSGSVSQALAERNKQTHILDFVLDFIHRGIVEAGYDGSDEPTYKKHPLNDFSKAKSAEDRWAVRVSSAQKVLAEALGGGEGGLQKMQAVFGPAACITGVTLGVPDVANGWMPEVGSDPETAEVMRRMAPRAISFGLLDTDPLRAPMFRLWVAAFSKAMSPVAETSPEVYWQDNILRSSETSGDDLHPFRGADGRDGFEKLAGKLDRSRIRVIHVELASLRNYLTPTFARSGALAYAYEHPEHPALPDEARRAPVAVNGAYDREAALLQWLAQEFLPANPGSRFVSSAALQQMAGPATGYSIPMDELRSALGDALKTWGNDPIPPKYLRAGGHYLSLADLFQVMTDALAEMDRGGKLPQTVKVAAVYGPTETTDSRGHNGGEVSVASVAHTCAGLSSRMHEDTGIPVPKNSIPFHVTVEGQEVTSAQFLLLMAEAIAAPTAEAKAPIRMASFFWGRDATYYRGRSIRDEGGVWTLKPAMLTSAEN